jgi:hypothetical protein
VEDHNILCSQRSVSDSTAHEIEPQPILPANHQLVLELPINSTFEFRAKFNRSSPKQGFRGVQFGFPLTLRLPPLVFKVSSDKAKRLFLANLVLPTYFSSITYMPILYPTGSCFSALPDFDNAHDVSFTIPYRGFSPKLVDAHYFSWEF